MNYISQNVYKYLSNPQKLIFLDGSNVSTFENNNPFVNYTSKISTELKWKSFDVIPYVTPLNKINTTSNDVITSAEDLKDKQQFTLVDTTIDSDWSMLLCNFGLSFTCSDFTSIKNDTIIFTISVDDQSIIKTFTIEPQYVNTFQIFDYLKVKSGTHFNISATSTRNLSFLPPKLIKFSTQTEPTTTPICKIIYL